MEVTPATIRRRTAADLGACVRVLRSVHEHHGYPASWPGDPAGWLAREHAWVAEVDGIVVGQVAVTVDGEAALVERLFVDPAFAGTGTGRALLRRGLAEARARASVVFLDVVAADDAANGLYRSDGWTEVSRTPIDWARDPSARLVRYRAP